MAVSTALLFGSSLSAAVPLSVASLFESHRQTRPLFPVSPRVYPSPAALLLGCRRHSLLFCFPRGSPLRERPRRPSLRLALRSAFAARCQFIYGAHPAVAAEPQLRPLCSPFFRTRSVSCRSRYRRHSTRLLSCAPLSARPAPLVLALSLSAALSALSGCSPHFTARAPCVNPPSSAAVTVTITSQLSTTAALPALAVLDRQPFSCLLLHYHVTGGSDALRHRAHQPCAGSLFSCPQHLQTPLTRSNSISLSRSSICSRDNTEPSSVVKLMTAHSVAPSHIPGRAALHSPSVSLLPS